jgi:16S rRNA (cytosine967-C5)-methyltransferase
MATEGLAARQAAVAILDAVLGERQPLSDVLAASDGPLSRLAPIDRARAQRLALTTLRHVEPADRVLAPHLRRPPPRGVTNVLRMAVCEHAVDGTAPHAVVNVAVELVRAGRRTGAFAGLANAVLRRVTEQSSPFAGLPPQRLPQWLRQPLVRLWGREVMSAIEAVQARTPPIDLTLREGATPPEGALRLPTGSCRLTEPGQISALSGYDEGHWWVQDAAAALPARILSPRAGERILDLCAAPGGKTLQLAAAGAQVTALDISGPRLERLRQNLARTGLAAQIVVGDALHWDPPAPFDAILLDAPCSATGTIRRHPDLPFVKDGTEVEGLADLQARMIDRALAMLVSGGRLVFCTCSLLPEEGEAQVLAALARHPGLTVEPPDFPGLDPRWRSAEGGLRLRPDHWAEHGGMDGFYMACLRKPAA